MPEPEQYWLTIRIRACDSEHRISHNRPMSLKVYFDENPDTDDADEIVEESDKRYVAEYSSVENLQSQGNQQFDFPLTKAEFNANKFELHIWGEPYGYVAVQKDGVRDGLYIGRLTLEPEHCHKGEVIHPPLRYRSSAGSKQIFCEIGIGASVADYMVEEFNNNLHSPQFEQVKRELDRAKENYHKAGIKRGSKEGADRGALIQLNAYLGAGGGGALNYPPDMNVGDSYNHYGAHDFACLVHSRGLSVDDWYDRVKGKAKEWTQDFVVCSAARNFRGEGGMWDHKPHIYSIWGADNRLGNSGFVYYYDIWSNMHYGFIGIKAGFSQEHLLEGANKAQVFDNAGATEDDPVDREAMLEGMRLADRRETVTIEDFLLIIRQHPGWEKKRRFGK